MIALLNQVLAELKRVRVLSRSKDGMSVVVGTDRKWSDGVETGGLRPIIRRPFAVRFR